MTQTIENQYLRITAAEYGAELQSIYDLERNQEVLWQGDPAFWARRSPVLFPNVGKHYNNIYRISGKEYLSRQHGFARDMVFSCIEKTDCTITYLLKSDEETLKVYPFAFDLKITYTLQDRDLSVKWEISTPGYDTIYFTIGGHPAFNVPVLPGTLQQDYSLYFNKKDKLEYFLIYPGSGVADTKTKHTLELNDGTCSIDPHMFDNDALIIDEQITKTGIRYPDGSPYLEMSCEGFPCFGIWNSPGAPFVCLEPWSGRCDDYGYDGELSDRPFINKVIPGELFEASYKLHIF
ncbi:MAG: aldose 1-epimerase family protein [Blautia sp.]|nr:aldose 1-epimerase family protein [Blautia sp.]